MIATCGQADCQAVASYRFTWPGRDEAFICAEHGARVKGIAAAFGLYVQLVPLFGSGSTVDVSNDHHPVE